MFGLIKNILGTSSGRTLKKLRQYIPKIYAAQEKLRSLSDDELRQQTELLKQRLQEGLSERRKSIDALKEKAEANQDLRLKIDLYASIDKAEEAHATHQDKILMEILPEAFAIVKETAQRFANKEFLCVTATKHDEEMAAQYDNVTIKEGKAYWANTWSAGGEKRQWGMVHYDVQLIGGIALHQGKVAEMRTGEGKTLVATLPIFLNALTGKGVHLVTVNPYLAKRDAEWMGPLFQFHGLTIDCIDDHFPHSPARRRAYSADITYGTGTEFGFDYLRDNMATSLDEKVQRGHSYAIVDEVDSVLIDEARTPLIISGPASFNIHQEYQALKPVVQQLYIEQGKMVADYLKEAKKKLQKESTKQEIEEGGVALFRVYRGLPKYKSFIQFLSEPGIKQQLGTTEDYFLQENARLMPEADAPLLFTIDEKLNNISLTDKGVDYLAEKNKDADFFVLPDISMDIAAISNDPALDEEAKATKKEKLLKEYTSKSARLHAVNQILKAYALFEKEVDYVVINRQVKIVDEKTGRILQGRRYSDGLHQALEAKENVKIEEPTQTYATITPQNQFRMYRKLAGMTGTAETEAAEFWEIYKLDVVVIPTNKPVIRDDRDDKVFRTKEEKMQAILKEVEELKKKGNPVLVNTTSVEASEEMRRMLGLKASQVLNARNHSIEAQIIARAGEASKVTVVTQMGGRGTDIKLSPEAKAAGGLFVLLSEKNPNERIDNQARGRSGRQGDPGATQAFVSLEDELIAHFRHGFMGKTMDKAFHEEGEAIEDPLITRALGTAQKRIEQQHFAARKRSLEYDDVMNMQRVVIYGKRDHALSGKRLSLDIMSMFYQSTAAIIEEAKEAQNVEKLQVDARQVLGVTTNITLSELSGKPVKQLIAPLYEAAIKHYEEKKAYFVKKMQEMIAHLPKDAEIKYFQLPIVHQEEEVRVMVDVAEAIDTKGEAALKALESTIILHFLDEHWKHHLLEMDRLRESARNAVYEQKDPLLIYKFEGLELFKKLMHRVSSATVAYLTHWTPQYADIDTNAERRHRSPRTRPAREQRSRRPFRSLSSLYGRYPAQSSACSTCALRKDRKQEPANHRSL